MHEYVPFSNTLVLFFVCLSLAQNIAWRKSDGKKVNRYREGKKTADIVIKRIQQTAAKVSPKMQSGYKKASVKDAWANHFAAFGAQKVDQIMQDYTDKSVLKAFDHTTGTLLTAKGLREIAQFFADLFAMLSDRSKLKAPVIETMEGTSTLDGSVYLIWSCSSSGITSATDTFIHDSANKIIRQNIAYESDPYFGKGKGSGNGGKGSSSGGKGSGSGGGKPGGSASGLQILSDKACITVSVTHMHLVCRLLYCMHSFACVCCVCV